VTWQMQPELVRQVFVEEQFHQAADFGAESSI
jgi:hypothetical protein